MQMVSTFSATVPVQTCASVDGRPQPYTARWRERGQGEDFSKCAFSEFIHSKHCKSRIVVILMIQNTLE